MKREGKKVMLMSEVEYDRMNRADEPKKMGIFSSLTSSIWGRLFKLNTKQISANKSRFLLGVLSVFIVVFVVTLLVTVFSSVTVVFVKMAELETGEIDLQLDSDSNLNYTQIVYLLQDQSHLNYSSPRWENSVSVFSSKVCPSRMIYTNDSGGTVKPFDIPLDLFNSSWPYLGFTGSDSCVEAAGGCFPSICKDSVGKDIQSDLYVYNSVLENRMQVGREWAFKDTKGPAPGKVIMTPSLASVLKLSAGDIAFIKFNASNFFGSMWNHRISPDSNDNGGNNADGKKEEALELYAKWLEENGKKPVNPTRKDWDTVYVPVYVERILSPGGKISSYSSEAILMEYDSFLPYFNQYLNPKIQPQMSQEFKKLKLNENAQSVNFNLDPSIRISTYIASSFDVMQSKLSGMGADISYRLGFPYVYLNFPVMKSMEQTKFLGLFLGLILNLVVAILLSLCVLLIYSLLTIDVSGQSFDLAVLKSIGITNNRLVFLLGMKSFSYSIPSLFLGLFLSQMILLVVSLVFERATYIQLGRVLSPTSFAYALFLSIAIPLISSVFPIREVMQQSIHNALDKRRSQAKGVKINIERNKGGSISIPALIVGILMAGFGFTIYYVFPLSMLTLNLSILGDILFGLILGMIFGLVSLSLNFQSVVERFVILLFMGWWESNTVLSVTRRNLGSHRPRNQKTTLMYGLSLGFVVFMAASLTLQNQSFLQSQKKSSGSFLKFYCVDSTDPRTGKLVQWTDFDQVEDFLDQYKDVIVSHTWASRSFESITGSSYTVTNIGRVFSDRFSLSAVSNNYYDTAYDEFLKISKGGIDGVQVSNGKQLMYHLYSALGSTTTVLSTHDVTKLGLQDGDTNVLIRSGDRTINRMQPLAFLDASPQFAFSKFPKASTPGLVSLPSLARLARQEGREISSILELPLASLMLKFTDGASDSRMDEVKNGMMGIISSQGKNGLIRNWDYRQATVRGQFTGTIIKYFFSFAIGVVMTICFFSLMSSMYTSVTEHTKEIGIMCVLGLSRASVYRIFIYEAFAVIFSSSVFGLIIGTFVAWTMDLQRGLWLQVELPFYFPWTFLIAIFIFSIIFSVWASYKPVANLFKKEIVSLLRE
eukprot:TRINITY_DN475_c0_g3_i1.p1 TRINITY_DN475_c0_g3~~TRINITY_DN475_c0_g3_i1.p1  ORF type:complete len:1104 (-),score=297.84 TRINITY_DN475_c0_g3_i1:6-3317(-)